MTMIKRLMLVVLLVGVGVGYYLYRAEDAKPKYLGPTVERIREGGVLRMGTDATYPPMEDLTPEGEVVGMDVDIAQALADELEVKLVVDYYDWDVLFDKLESGEVDVVLSSVTITAERAEKWAFSNPYLNAGQVVLAKVGKADLFTSRELVGKKLGVLVDTTSYDYAVSAVGKENVVSHYVTFDEVMDGLAVDEFEATIVDLPVAVEIVKKDPRYAVYGEPVTQEFYGVVMRRGEPDLVNFVNLNLAAMKRDGRFGAIEQKWLKNTVE